jgi:hypothetical protein
MRQSLIIILLVAIGCSKTKDNSDYYSEKVLGEQFDSKGRLIKRVVTGRIPGEDIYLTISKYDTTGKVTEEYGAKPYGKKYRTTFKYNSENQLAEELNYTFFSGDFDHFENYQGDRLYNLTDTMVSFDGIVDYKTLFTYNLQDSLVIELHYYSVYDSTADNHIFKLSRIDTVDAKENGY